MSNTEYEMNKKATPAVGGLGLADVLGVVFVVLKLVGVINWSWVWVLAPFWIQIVLVLIVALIMFIVVIVVSKL